MRLYRALLTLNPSRTAPSTAPGPLRRLALHPAHRVRRPGQPAAGPDPGPPTGLEGLREGARGGGGPKQRLRSALVVAEVTASVVLLISAGLLLRALWRIEAVDPGFRSEGVLTLRTALPLPQYDSTARRIAFYRQVVSGLEALPGVERAAYISFLPMVMGGGIWPVGVRGQQVDRPKDLVIRAARDPMSLLPAVRDIVRRSRRCAPPGPIRWRPSSRSEEPAHRLQRVRVLRSLVGPPPRHPGKAHRDPRFVAG